VKPGGFGERDTWLRAHDALNGGVDGSRFHAAHSGG
jgi:hypothetical protein